MAKRLNGAVIGLLVAGLAISLVALLGGVILGFSYIVYYAIEAFGLMRAIIIVLIGLALFGCLWGAIFWSVD